MFYFQKAVITDIHTHTREETERVYREVCASQSKTLHTKIIYTINTFDALLLPEKIIQTIILRSNRNYIVGDSGIFILKMQKLKLAGFI